MKKLPPLRAIEMFEAVGRLGSVTAAADELGVSPGAITQQVHKLETFLRARLVQRHGRGIELTHWGNIFLKSIVKGLDHLREAGPALRRAQSSKHITVSALPSLTNKWLGPLLFDWKLSHPEAIIHLEGVDPEPRLDDGEADFRISYGSRARLHSRHTTLFTDSVTAIGSPALLAGAKTVRNPKDLLAFPLLWIDWGAEFLMTPSWKEWFVCAGTPCEEVRQDLTFSLSSAALDAAAEGRGLVLGQHSLTYRALKAGTLVKLFDFSLALPEHYFLSWGREALDKPMGTEFKAWLINEARSVDSGRARVRD